MLPKEVQIMLEKESLREKMKRFKEYTKPLEQKIYEIKKECNEN